jgi:serine/threonine-protein kinase
MNRARLLALAAGLVLDVTTGRDGRAADASTDAEAADALFQEGRALLEGGHCAEAIPKFVASQRLDRGVGTLLNLAFCEEQLGKTASAWRHYGEAADAAHAAGETERERIARSRAAALEPNVPKLTITVGAPVPELEVDLDGAPMPRASLGSPIPVDPGPHAVEAKIPSSRPWSAHVEVDPQHEAVVLIPALQPTASPTPTPPRDAPNGAASERWRTPTIVTLGSAGLVGLGLDAAFVVAAKARYRDSQSPSVCTSANHCTAQGQEARSVARTYGDVATVAGVAGGALLAGAAIVWLTAPKKAHRANAALALDPVLGPSTWGLSVSSPW